MGIPRKKEGAGKEEGSERVNSVSYKINKNKSNAREIRRRKEERVRGRYIKREKQKDIDDVHVFFF